MDARGRDSSMLSVENTPEEETSQEKTLEDKMGEEPGGATHRCPSCGSVCPEGGRSKRLITMGAGPGMGGARVPSLGWFRTDVSISFYAGMLLHPQAMVRLGYYSSVERFMMGMSLGGKWLPLDKWKWGTPYARGSFDLILAGAGVQPGLTGALGYTWWSPWHVGVFAESRFAGRLTGPRVFEIVGSAGVFVYF